MKLRWTGNELSRQTVICSDTPIIVVIKGDVIHTMVSQMFWDQETLINLTLIGTF